jgi:peptide/nickel transport system substrate-binding protein
MGVERRGAGRLLAAGLLLCAAAPARGATAYVETPMLEAAVAAGQLPPVAERLPSEPALVDFSGKWKKPGRHGGELRTLIGRAKDVRLMVVYGYARLVGYDENYELVPDLLAAVEEQDGRIFTLKLRRGHKWSNGQPFTAEDFRYFWEDVVNNAELTPAGPPPELLVDGQPPTFEVLDETTVRYAWPAPNPYFLPNLAGAAPLFIYRPSHYLKRYNKKYADPSALQAAMEKERKHSWAALHNHVDNMYRFDNPALPTLQPWFNITEAPSTRFVGERNPYYHRVDAEGRQLPYIDRIVLQVSDGKLIPAKAGTGEVDLQARSLFFSNYTFLRENQASYGFTTRLWDIASGSHMALFPNLNVSDPVWRQLLRDVRFRRALSLGIDREGINETLFFGLAKPANNTVLPESPLYREAYRTAWIDYDPERANELLDQVGLSKRNNERVRLLPDGRPIEIIVETAGEDTEQVDILQLIQENWRGLGIKLFIKPSQREVFRNRVFSGECMMAVWSGMENGLPTPAMSPEALAPTSQQQLQWPKWGQFHETKGSAGEAIDLPEARRLMQLNQAWLTAKSRAERERIWHEMLQTYTEQQFSIGLISQVKQPVVVANALMNVPEEGVYSWEPGAQFGIYRPDTFWFKR